MRLSDGGLRFVWVLGVLSLAASIQQYFQGRPDMVIATLIVAAISAAMLTSYYLRVKSIRNKKL